MAPPVSVAHVEANLAVLTCAKSPATLKSDFDIDLQIQAHVHSQELVDITPVPAWKRTAEERLMSEDDARGYRMSRNLPNYMGMPWIVAHGRTLRTHVEYRSILDPSLLDPPSNIRIQRAPPRVGIPWHFGPPRGGNCARQLGKSTVLNAFADAVALGQVDILECAAQSPLVLQPGQEYSFDELFDKNDFPYEQVDGRCCLAHYDKHEERRKRSRGKITNYVKRYKARFFRRRQASLKIKPRLKKLSRKSSTACVVGGALSSPSRASASGSMSSLDVVADGMDAPASSPSSASTSESVAPLDLAADAVDAPASSGWGLPVAEWEVTSTSGWSHTTNGWESPSTGTWGLSWGSSSVESGWEPPFGGWWGEDTSVAGNMQDSEGASGSGSHV
ncbi:hypothetical protein BD626DRAFT_625674 [Schizophyllum amplum]|uniref:Uncharacterized protein n=1 Tax=Schizophyllum amplum TaxID=97359 RepID=A0A550D0E4_9AGAR|nr:hypothetical protein BD626DRAFT_625674 [Auriculariopsis ampla]